MFLCGVIIVVILTCIAVTLFLRKTFTEKVLPNSHTSLIMQDDKLNVPTKNYYKTMSKKYHTPTVRKKRQQNRNDESTSKYRDSVGNNIIPIMIVSQYSTPSPSVSVTTREYSLQEIYSQLSQRPPVEPSKALSVDFQLPETPPPVDSQLSQAPYDTLPVDSPQSMLKATITTEHFHETSISNSSPLLTLTDEPYSTKSWNSKIKHERLENNTVEKFIFKDEEDNKSTYSSLVTLPQLVADSKTLEERETFISNNVSLSSASIGDDHDYTFPSNDLHKANSQSTQFDCELEEYN